MCKAISSNVSGNQQPVRRIAKMSLKSFSFGSLTSSVLATLVLAFAPIPFSDLYFLESVSAQATSDRKAEADRLFAQGNQLYKVSKYREAFQSWEQALQIYQEIRDRNGESNSLNNFGVAYQSLGQYQKAIEFYQQSLAIEKQIENRKGEGISLNNLGLAYLSLRQYEKAIDFFQQSLMIYKQIGDRRSEGVLLNNLGSAYQYLRQYQKAIDFFQQSLAIARQIENRNGEENSLNNLGNTYYFLGQYQKAIDFSQQSLAIARQIENRNGEGNSLNSLGNAYYSLGQYQKAIDFFQQSLVIARQIENRNGEGTSLGNLGNTYYSLGQYQKAIDFFQQSLAIAKPVGDRYVEGTSLNNLGNAYYSLGQYQKAINFFQQSLAIAKPIGDRHMEGLAFRNLGLIFAKLKQPELAILFYKQSVNVRETIRKDILKLSKEEQKSYLATIEKDYRALADLLLKQDRILEAQQVLDLLKVQELSGYFRSADVGDSAKQADYQPPEQNIIALGNELAKLQQLDTLTKEQEQRLAYLTNQESDRNAQFNAFLNSPEVQKQIKQLTLEKAKNVDLEEYNRLRASLTEIKNAVVFYPLILEDRLELILITANTAPIRKTVKIKREDLNKDISDFLSNLRDPSSADVQADGQKFYNYLLKPFEKELKDANIQTIIYSPDGQLRYIPLAALHDGNQWLIERYRINNITASSLTNLRPRTYKPPKVLAAAATNSHNIKLGDRSIPFGALPATKTEVEAIATLLPNTTTFIDQQFNKATTIPKMQSNNIVHLATHGYFAIGKPEDSFIVFGDGDKATITDMEKWTLTNVALVVLSACETAIGGKLGNGIEILGLGYQIQNRGAGAAIASLWKVSDNGTSELMQALYKNLSQKNISSSEALRQAQIAMIRSDKKGNSSDRGTGIRIVGTVPTNEETQLSHPFYWSAFILIGNGL
ncbi:tetratricopeptide repeat protein [Pseudanabaena galeata UHCC 0370]|uniref:Tetratricopeptide repeat protein n=1 Tax=Pseudanabaena galeata UHCC 0370 TaxID=3110310 RepID=A0ABU5TER6_9CYAN|nr:tetratricopeptide repeat protein [Pseudanabaena galeata]MEA5476746.1 tetratricopeptide repeat protein [Pseudanabaena galeata UHCC 0370]